MIFFGIIYLIYDTHIRFTRLHYCIQPGSCQYKISVSWYTQSIPKTPRSEINFTNYNTENIQNQESTNADSTDNL